MTIPNKIGIVDTPQSTDSRLRFDTWEGYDSNMQRKFLALKINEIIDFLSAHPAVANDIPDQLKVEGDSVVHEHNYRLLQRFGAKGAYECTVCGETVQRLIPPSQA